MKKLSVINLFVVVAAAALLTGAHLDAAVVCNPTELSSCAAAITSAAEPSAACCQKLNEQRPCLCGYMRNPLLSGYVNSPGARKVASTCGVSVKC